MDTSGPLDQSRTTSELGRTRHVRSGGSGEFCVFGCYWPDCEHRADGDARPAPPAGTRWVVRGGVEVAEPRPATDTLVDAVDEYFGEVLLITGRPWSPR